MAASDYEVLDERFRNCVNRTSHVERLSVGARWTEGPVYFPAGKYLLFSDIPNDRIMRYDETDGSVSIFRQPSGNASHAPRSTGASPSSPTAIKASG